MTGNGQNKKCRETSLKMIILLKIIHSIFNLITVIMKNSPELKARDSSPSPIKVKDYFTNPLHKIKQPAFTEVGFTHSALNTFVKTFTNRSNNKYINLSAVKNYIKSFTNNNVKLMALYEDFFTKNFVQSQSGLIETEHFVQFFVQEDKQQFKEMSQRNFKKLFKDLNPINAENLHAKAYELGVPLSLTEAEKIIKMINYESQQKEKQIREEDLVRVLMKDII